MPPTPLPLSLVCPPPPPRPPALPLPPPCLCLLSLQVMQWEDRFYKANRAHTYLGKRVSEPCWALSPAGQRCGALRG